MAAADAGSYYVVVSGAFSSVTNSATLTVRAATTASGPSNLERYTGQSVSFSATVSGSGPYSCQWLKDGVDIAGATSETYSIASVSAVNAGTYCLVVTGPCNSTTNFTTLTVNNCLPITAGMPQLNPQTGLYEQKVRVTNPTEITFDAVQVLISGLRDGVRVYNASGNADGVPFVAYNQQFAPGENVDLTIEYFVPDLRTPDAQLCAQPVAATTPPQQTGTPVMIDRYVRLSDGSFLIEFKSVPGQLYYIQCCEDFNHWTTVTPGVSNSANRIQWIDNGPPKTDSFPTKRPCRFYRVITAQ